MRPAREERSPSWRCVSLVLRVNWAREGGREEERWTRLRESWDWHRWRWAALLSALSCDGLLSPGMWVSIRLTGGMLTPIVALHPKVLIRQVWCGAQETSPQEPRLPSPQLAIACLSLRISLLNSTRVRRSKQGRNKRTACLWWQQPTADIKKKTMPNYDVFSSVLLIKCSFSDWHISFPRLRGPRFFFLWPQSEWTAARPVPKVQRGTKTFKLSA